MKKLVLLRKLSQLFFLLLFVYVLWATTYPLQSALSTKALFMFDPLVMFMTALSARLLLSGFVFSLVMIGLTFLLGRFFCGWVCPMGTLIDWAGRLKRHKTEDLLSVQQKHNLRLPKFVILGVVAVLALAGVQVAWVLDPIVMVARVVSLNIIPAVTFAFDRSCQFLIQKFGLYGGFYDLYRTLKEGLLGVNVHFFANSLVTLAFFLVVVLFSALILRLWCRMLCPLGACYAINAWPSLLERQVKKCTFCGKCQQTCPMDAIKQGPQYRKGECILCMECVYSCPQHSTAFVWRNPFGVKQNKPADKGVTRGQFLAVLGAGLSWMTARSRSALAKTSGNAGHPVIRPPGALAEGKFVNACVRCGNCMKVCITNGLQPVMLDSGVAGVWTPQLLPEIGYCEYNCKLCGEVCPTGAIAKLPLEAKKKQRLGLARIDRSICFAWDGNKECIVCEEHCPVSDKAIKVREEIVAGKKIFRPYVDPVLCIGCGICQNKCPVRPDRAIRVDSDFL